ncbi:MAG: acylphosphatase [Candidatus Acidiferrales bacterium]
MTQSRLARLFYVSGAVQGVGFRYFAQRASVRFGLTGYVRNLRDGRVEVYAMGTESQLSMLRQELRRGPRAASVAEVMEEEAEVEEKHTHEFSIEQDI